MSGSSAASGAAEGREVAPGVRRIDHGKRESMISGYKAVALRDMVYQPGATSTNPSMAQLDHRVLKRCSAPSTYADARGL